MTRREVWFAWNAKEVVRQIYDHTDDQLAVEWVDRLVRDFQDDSCPPEVRRLGRTIGRWRDQIVAWHRSHVTNGPTEAVNNLIKRVKRVAFGFTRFRNYRIRVLLYAGDPTGTCSPPSHPAEIRSAVICQWTSRDAGKEPVTVRQRASPWFVAARRRVAPQGAGAGAARRWIVAVPFQPAARPWRRRSPAVDRSARPPRPV